MVCQYELKHADEFDKLILVALAVISSLSRVKANLLIVFLKGSKIFPCLREFTFLHTLSNIPVDKGPLGVHQVKLMVKPSPGLGNGSCIAKHAHCPADFGQVATRNNSWRLVVNAYLEASGAPVDKLDAPLGLDGGNGSVHVLGNDVTPVEEAACHVLAMTRIALDHLVGRLKASVGDLGDCELLVVGLLGRDDWCIGDQGEVDPGVGHQVGLELSQIHVQGSIESQGSRD